MSWGALLFHAALIVLLVLKKIVYCILINTSSSEYSVLYFIEHSKRCIPVCPLRDFISTSDIDWSQSISDIDRQLYAKYGLSDEEIAFIEKMIKPME